MKNGITLIHTHKRETMLTHKDILLKLEQLEAKMSIHDDEIKIPEGITQPSQGTRNFNRF